MFDAPPHKKQLTENGSFLRVSGVLAGKTVLNAANGLVFAGKAPFPIPTDAGCV